MAGMTLRRMRQDRHVRALAREVELPSDKFIQPLFVVEGLTARTAVPGLAGVHRENADSLARQVEADVAAGITKFLLFGVPGDKRERDFDASYTATQVAALRRRFGADIWLAVDVCLCSSTTHGHCGILDDTREHIANGATVEALAAAAMSYAQAGADCVAPSDMMDGRIGAIRRALDVDGLERVLVMSYAAKFHSGLYGPFRVAADSTPGAGSSLRDRATYQIDPARPADALASAERDAREGADILMVKPGLPYLDVLASLSQALPQPWAVYQTSGEQAALELLAGAGLGDLDRLQLETWTAFRRAGADMIISYAARRARALLGA
ncbi:MAG: porphobilinogen synthase [Gammaproteobacteria bacterium]|nr:porphobilinogen synthase [Gammaproteobacteria bacterium]